jgi:hypothetical protein
LLFSILKISGLVDFFKLFPNKYYVLPVLIVWFFANFRHCNEENIDRIVSDFNQKIMGVRRAWGLTAIVSSMLPLILIAVMLTK